MGPESLSLRVKWFRPRPPRDPAVEAAKVRALEVLTRALEAAKRARDAGRDVRADRSTMKLARAAFEAGDYEQAAAYGAEIFRRYEGRPPSDA